MVYRDFDVLFERAGECYQIKVLNSPAGQTTGQFKLPFSELELENLLLRVGRPRRGVRRIDSPEMDAVKQFGGRLFESVFDGEVGQCLRASLDEVEQKEHGLRLRLRLTDVPELADLPWEYIYNPSLNRFLSLSISSPIVRYLELSVRHRPLEVKPPLRVLVMISSPYNFPKLDVEQEWAKLKHAFAEFEKDGQVVLERMENATLATLQRHLRKKRYHIFHFMGHAGFVQQAQDGVLILEDEQDRGRPVSAQYLGTLLHDHPSLRLALLNACEGARASRNDPFSGTAQSLVQQGLPAVIAMQFEVTDEASITFSQWFYEFLAKGHPVDECLSEARKAIFTQGNDIEWGTPVLYMRAPDGRIFDIQPRTEEKKNEHPSHQTDLSDDETVHFSVSSLFAYCNVIRLLQFKIREGFAQFFIQNHRVDYNPS
ncbi:MAG: CHAT domain-containing protein [bacterium]